MKTAPLPIDEVERVQELVRYQILDTDEEKDYNDLVQLAADICNCPLSSITFVDAKRQWFKASINIPDKQTSRDVSFCSHAILQDDVYVVEDASTDPIFFDYPNVTGGMCIRFYAGAPILSSKGKKLGTLCVIDTKIRKLAESQAHALKTMASMVSRLLELRIDARKLVNRSTQLLKSVMSYQELFDYNSIAQWIYDMETHRFIRANNAACSLYGYTEDEFSGLRLSDLMKMPLQQFKNAKSATVVATHKKKDGSKVSVEATLSVIRERQSNLIIGSIIDLSEKLQLQKDLIAEKEQAGKLVENATLSAQLKERKLLGRELHDNITQMLSSTNIYLDIAYSDDEMRLDLIQKSQQNLISAINQVRDLSRRLVNTPISGTLESSLEEILNPYRSAKIFEIHYGAEGDFSKITDDQKTAIVRIIQESLHNAKKYAMAANLFIRLENRNGKILIEIRDDGAGFKPAKNVTGIGLKNMRERAEQLNGTCDIRSAPGNGTVVSITFPE